MQRYTRYSQNELYSLAVEREAEKRLENEQLQKRIEELESLTDWRDVTKELPKENGRYLCRTVNDGYVALEFKAAVATLYGDYGSVWHDNVENYTHAVTHWRPLVPVETDQQPDGGCDEDS